MPTDNAVSRMFPKRLSRLLGIKPKSSDTSAPSVPSPLPPGSPRRSPGSSRAEQARRQSLSPVRAAANTASMSVEQAQEISELFGVAVGYQAAFESAKEAKILSGSSSISLRENKELMSAANDIILLHDFLNLKKSVPENYPYKKALEFYEFLKLQKVRAVGSLKRKFIFNGVYKKFSSELLQGAVARNTPAFEIKLEQLIKEFKLSVKSVTVNEIEKKIDEINEAVAEENKASKKVEGSTSPATISDGSPKGISSGVTVVASLGNASGSGGANVAPEPPVKIEPNPITESARTPLEAVTASFDGTGGMQTEAPTSPPVELTPIHLKHGGGDDSGSPSRLATIAECTEPTYTSTLAADQGSDEVPASGRSLDSDDGAGSAISSGRSDSRKQHEAWFGGGIPDVPDMRPADRQMGLKDSDATKGSSPASPKNGPSEFGITPDPLSDSMADPEVLRPTRYLSSINTSKIFTSVPQFVGEAGSSTADQVTTTHATSPLDGAVLTREYRAVSAPTPDDIERVQTDLEACRDKTEKYQKNNPDHQVQALTRLISELEARINEVKNLDPLPERPSESDVAVHNLHLSMLRVSASLAAEHFRRIVSDDYIGAPDFFSGKENSPEMLDIDHLRIESQDLQGYQINLKKNSGTDYLDKWNEKVSQEMKVIESMRVLEKDNHSAKELVIKQRDVILAKINKEGAKFNTLKSSIDENNKNDKISTMLMSDDWLSKMLAGTSGRDKIVFDLKDINKRIKTMDINFKKRPKISNSENIFEMEKENKELASWIGEFKKDLAITNKEAVTLYNTRLKVFLGE